MLTTRDNTYRYALDPTINWQSFEAVEIQLTTDPTLVGFPFESSEAYNPSLESDTDSGGTTVWYLQFGALPPSGRSIRILGTAGYDQLVADGDVLPLPDDIGGKAVEWLYEYAEYKLFSWDMNRQPTGQLDRAAQQAQLHLQKALQDLKDYARSGARRRLIVPGSGTRTQRSGLHGPGLATLYRWRLPHAALKGVSVLMPAGPRHGSAGPGMSSSPATPWSWSLEATRSRSPTASGAPGRGVPLLLILRPVRAGVRGDPLARGVRTASVLGRSRRERGPREDPRGHQRGYPRWPDPHRVELHHRDASLVGSPRGLDGRVSHGGWNQPLRGGRGDQGLLPQRGRDMDRHRSHTPSGGASGGGRGRWNEPRLRVRIRDHRQVHERPRDPGQRRQRIHGRTSSCGRSPSIVRWRTRP
jgi:hypothetical protein